MREGKRNTSIYQSYSFDGFLFPIKVARVSFEGRVVNAKRVLKIVTVEDTVKDRC